ncbi:hypothetical protein [Planctomyces sp. SH-PL14]|uniref:hypothetical protein n=1 Tax=Planctomyces sp. SH-PL14 TaxID=1632864 RepID=UPI00078E94E0|nr:hypothetical protein [Planctomyces sp. SH-PL14]AMV19574.1 hypothetical protein VT03_16890 [Planctomyces sp. SH-PL14]
MNALQKEQPAFDRAVCDAMVASTPDDWSVIVLTIERPDGSTAIGELSHELSTPDRNGSATPDDSLYEATYRLDELFQRHGAVFRRAVYRVELLPESWRYTVDFEYVASKSKKRFR